MIPTHYQLRGQYHLAEAGVYPYLELGELVALIHPPKFNQRLQSHRTSQTVLKSALCYSEFLLGLSHLQMD